MAKELRALNDVAIDRIEEQMVRGQFDDYQINRLFHTLRIQRHVLKEMFELFNKEPLRRVSTANPVPNSQLTYYKELVSMEDFS